MIAPLRAAALAAAACLSLGSGASAAGFAPDAFFAGTTRSSGVLTDASGHPTGRLTGTTRGGRDPEGATVFDQTIRFDDGTVTQRRFRVVRTGPATVDVTGSDVIGVGHGTVAGNTLHLVSTIVAPGVPGGVDFDQVMTLRPDGRTLDNRSTVTKLGVVVRRIDEVFVRSGLRRQAGRRQ